MERIILVLVLCCLEFTNAGKVLWVKDVIADIEMAVVAEQIAMNAMCNMIEKNEENIRELTDKIDNLKAHAHVEPSYTGHVVCVEENDLSKPDSDGKRTKMVNISFDKAYSAPPKVLASLHRLEIPKISHYSFEVSVKTITKEGFTIVCATRSNETIVELASVSWLSIPSAY
ncbi:ATP synthase subunit [Plakobranchus ocellatus]|uniref:ATP synthase subunit n=1 Tax=Plakobranchus ocellatus TaxID=259542 RepID=A0AAV4ANH1_9GAST|nr:ATP synthase subunit [Plakobranchus ocellatus]